MGKSVVLLLFAFTLFVMSPGGSTVANASSHNGAVNVTRDDVLNVAKEFHPPGCTTSMTADYCQLRSAFDMRDEIWTMIKQGMTKDEIVNKLVDKYGERILASPTKSGFNLISWILPGAGIGLGGLAIGLLVRRRVRRNLEVRADNRENEKEMTPEQQKWVQDELRNRL